MLTALPRYQRLTKGLQELSTFSDGLRATAIPGEGRIPERWPRSHDNDRFVKIGGWAGRQESLVAQRHHGIDFRCSADEGIQAREIVGPWRPTPAGVLDRLGKPPLSSPTLGEMDALLL